jgi:hypothetical protein
MVIGFTYKALPSTINVWRIWGPQHCVKTFKISSNLHRFWTQHCLEHTTIFCEFRTSWHSSRSPLPSSLRFHQNYCWDFLTKLLLTLSSCCPHHTCAIARSSPLYHRAITPKNISYFRCIWGYGIFVILSYCWFELARVSKKYTHNVQKSELKKKKKASFM